MELVPVEISANRTSRELVIRWNDGHLSVYPFQLVRAACPCASCRGGHENMSEVPTEEMFNVEIGDTPSTRIRSVDRVGSYAISIEWEDGHHFGIYTWRYLRSLCPCPICRPRN